MVAYEGGAVAALTLKSVPKGIHRELRRRAVRHHRSLNSEIIACLEQVLGAGRIDADLLLSSARTLRAKFKGKVTGPALNRLKNQGRA